MFSLDTVTTAHDTSRARAATALAPRVCVVGPESSGKTSLAQGLAERFGTVCVPEYANIYIVEKHALGAASWWPEEFAHIANTQTRLEEEARTGAKGLLVCDTDAFSVWVWHRDYVQRPSRAVRQIAEQNPADLYVLVGEHAPSGGDTPDGRRTDRRLRAYRRELKRSGLPFVEVSGSAEERIAQAADAVESLLGR